MTGEKNEEEGTSGDVKVVGTMIYLN